VDEQSNLGLTHNRVNISKVQCGHVTKHSLAAWQPMTDQYQYQY